MILKALLKRAVQYVADNPTEHGSQLIEKSASHLNKSISDFLMELDVRDVGILRDYLPKAFPKSLQHPTHLDVYEDPKGRWIVRPQLKFKMPRGWNPARDSDSGGYYG